MATVVLGVIGAGLGSIIPGAGWALGWSIGTTIGGMIDAANRPGAQIGKLNDFQVTGSSYGTPIMQVWGTHKLAGTVIWSTDLRESKHSVGGGGGSGGGGGTQQYTYSLDVAVAICKVGRNVSLQRVWADDLVIWDTNNNSHMDALHFYSGSESQGADSFMQAAQPSGTPPIAYRGTCYVLIQNLQVTDFGNRLPNLQFEVVTDPVTVEQIASDVMAQVGINCPFANYDMCGPQTGTDVDTGQAGADTIQGFRIEQRGAARDSLSTITDTYFYDTVEVDGVLRLVKRGGQSQATIDYGDLSAMVVGEGGGEDMGSRVEERRQQESELHSSIDFGYYNPSKNYEQQVQHSVRETALTVNPLTLGTSFSFDDTTARQIAERHLYTEWLERLQYAIILPPSYMALAPADCVMLSVGGKLTRLRITGYTVGLPGVISLTLLRDDSRTLTQTALGSPPQAPYTPVASPASPTDFYPWSGWELRTQDQAFPGIYVVGCARGSNWRGGQVFYSPDSGASYTASDTVDGSGVLGTCLNTLPTYAGTPGTLDSVNTLSVSVIDGGALTSIAASQLANGGNVAIVGGEIIQFQTATLTSPGHYTLSGLVRGFRGSPMTHSAGEHFTVPTPNSAVRISLPETEVGKTYLVKVLSPGQQLADVTAQSVVVQERNPTALETTVGTLTGDVGTLTGTVTTLTGTVGALAAASARASVTITTSSLADGAADTSEAAAIGKSGNVLRLSSDVPCYFCLYASAADMAADAGRDLTTDPAPGRGVFLETLTAAGALSIDLAPPPFYYDNDTTITGNLPVKIVNHSGVTSVVNVTLTFLSSGEV